MHQGLLKWRSRRGMLELDLLLSSFSEYFFSRLSRDEQEAYLLFLSEEDQVLWRWLFVTQQPPVKFHQIIVKILDFYQEEKEKEFSRVM